MATDTGALARRYMTEIWAKGKLEVIDELVDDNIELKDPMTPHGVRGKEVVRDILMTIAQENQDILPNPAPQVFLADFGDNALAFELRCVVRNAGDILAVRSAVNFAILARFREKGIDIPYPTRTLHITRDGGPAAPGAREP